MTTNRLGPICFLEILKEYSDVEHILTMQDVMQKMKSIYNVTVDRRTVYGMVDVLQAVGYDISTFRENGRGYYLRDRDFEVSEVRLLIDSVYSSQSISNSQTTRLVKKLGKLLNSHTRKQYKSLTVNKTGRKTTNHETFLNIELLDEAIRNRKKVEFVYLEYGFDKQLKPRREKRYCRDPYQMIATNEHYYLVCKKAGHETASLYRIDRMADVEILEEDIDTVMTETELQEMKEQTVYAWGGKPETVVMRCKNHVLGDVIDKFGQNISIRKEEGEETFIATLKVAPQGVQYWAQQYLENVEVLQPQWMREKIIATLKHNAYLKEED